MRILLVEDNVILSELLTAGLHESGFGVQPVFYADEALSALKSSSYDMLILDLGLPDDDGINILNTIRAEKNTIPVLILTARDALDQKIKGFNAGADDYLIKPCALEELVVRCRALLRRPAQATDMQMAFENIVYDSNTRQTEIDGKIIKLSKRETSLLEIMMRSSNKIVQKEKIELQIYGHGEEGSANSVEVLVHRLKKRLASENAKVEIHTLRGIGYMMVGTDREKLA